MKFPLLLTTLLGITLATPAWSHSDEYLNTVQAPHGGQLRMAGPLHYELVAKNGELVVYVTDHADKPAAVAGAKGSATVLSGAQKTTVPLLPSGPNQLKGSGKFELTPSSKVVVSITLPGQAAQQARFEPGKQPPAKAGHDTHKK